MDPSQGLVRFLPQSTSLRGIIITIENVTQGCLTLIDPLLDLLPLGAKLTRTSLLGPRLIGLLLGLLLGPVPTFGLLLVELELFEDPTHLLEHRRQLGKLSRIFDELFFFCLVLHERASTPRRTESTMSTPWSLYLSYFSLYSSYLPLYSSYLPLYLSYFSLAFCTLSTAF